MIKKVKKMLISFYCILIFACFGGCAGIKIRGIDTPDVTVIPQMENVSIIQSMGFSPNGRQVISGSRDGTIHLWDIRAGQKIKSFYGHSGGVSFVAFSPNRRQVFSAGTWDGKIRVWNTMTGEELRSFYGHSSLVSSTALSPCGGQIFLGYTDGTAKIWDMESGSEIRSFCIYYDTITSAAFSYDGNQVLISSMDGSLRLWDIETGNEISRLKQPHERSPFWNTFSVAFSPNGMQALSSTSGYIFLWDTGIGQKIKRFRPDHRNVPFITFTPNGKQAITGSMGAGEGFTLWSIETGEGLKTFYGHSRWVGKVTFSPCGRHILSNSGDSTMRLWNMRTGQEIAQFISFPDDEWVVITPDGFYTASANGDKHLLVQAEEKNYVIDEFRAALHRPRVVSRRLSGR
ncbi:MAG: WD40 repeat domain-containing protein [Spirochaetes bacterium]|nr:WD40 repeat domain-containing protein [Spirochaetota bacterium]